MQDLLRLVNLDLEQLLKPFELVNGRLLRNGKHCGTLWNGREYFVTLRGKRILTCDIAWTLYYGSPPLWPIWRFDPEPNNVSPANLFPMRHRLRCRLTKVEKGYMHPLSTRVYQNKAEAENSWRCKVKERLAEDKEYCIAEGARITERLRIEAPKQALYRQQDEFAPYIVEAPFNKKPKAPENGRAHYYRGKWVIVNAPKFIGDDYLLRIRAALDFLAGYQTTWDSAPVIRWRLKQASASARLEQAASQEHVSNQYDAGNAREIALPVADAALAVVA